MATDGTFAVSRIIQHRGTSIQNDTSGQVQYQYLVRWKDEENQREMHETTDTWEPTSSFVDGEQCTAIQDYWKAYEQARIKQEPVRERPILPAYANQHQVIMVNQQPNMVVQNQTQFVQLVQPNQTSRPFVIQSPNHSGQPITILQSPTGPSQARNVQMPMQQQFQQQGQQMIMINNPSAPPQGLNIQPQNIQIQPTNQQSPSQIQPNFPVLKTSPTGIPDPNLRLSVSPIRKSPSQTKKPVDPRQVRVDVKQRPKSPPLPQIPQIPQTKKPKELTPEERAEIQKAQSTPSVSLQIHIKKEDMDKMKSQNEVRQSYGGIDLLLAAASSQPVPQVAPPPPPQRVNLNEPTIAIPVDSSLIKQEKQDAFIDQHRPSDESGDPNEPRKKKRGRPPGLTKAKIEERRKQREAEAAKMGALNIHPPQKRPRGRPPKQPKQKGQNKKQPKSPSQGGDKNVPKSDSSDSSDSDSDQDSSETDSSDLETESSDEERKAKTKLRGEPLDKLKKMSGKEPGGPGKQTSPVRVSTPPRDTQSQPQPRKTTPPRSPAKPAPSKSLSTPPPPKTPDHPMSPEMKRKTPKSPDKAARRASLNSQPSPFDPKAGEKTPNSKSASSLKQRIASTPKSVAPSREAKTPEDLKWAIKTLSKKEVVQAFKNGTDKMPVTGFIPGMLHQEVMQAAENPKGVDELARKLYGSCTFTDEGRAIISDEVNGKQRHCKNGDSALIGAAKKKNEHGGPAMINALCGIAGADPNQKHLTNGNTALHVAAAAGIPANIQNLLAHLSQVNWRNNEGKTALFLAITKATQFERLIGKFKEAKEETENAYSCIELLLDAGANICDDVIHAAGSHEVGDIIHYYNHIINTEIFTYIKKFMGKISFQVHDKCLFKATVVPRDQNMVEIVIPPVDIYRPGVFLTLFAAHGDYQGYGPDFEKIQDLRLHGNPCLVSDVVWHRPKVGPHPEECMSLDGLQSVHKKGPFIPGRAPDKYDFVETVSQFITFLKFLPNRENKYTVVTMPAYWTTEKLFLRVYPCELTIADTTFQKGAPEILRRKEHCMEKYREYEESLKKVKAEWEEQKDVIKNKKCEILKEGKPCPGNNPRR